MAIFAIAAILVVVIGASNVSLPLPAGIREHYTVVGKIQHCDIEDHIGGGHTPFLFVGVRLTDASVPYLRWNPGESMRKFIESECRNRDLVEIRYSPQRLLIRPTVTYWIDSLKNQKRRPD